MMDERWLPVPGWEGRYEVSDLGRFRGKPGRYRCNTWRIVRPQPTRKGYLKLAMWSGNRVRRKFAHRLVMLAFNGQCPPAMEINHINGVKTDNRLFNLEYVEPAENLKHARDVLRNIQGSGNHKAKLSEADVSSIRVLRGMYGIGAQTVAEMFGVHPGTISGIVLGKTWRHIPVHPWPERFD